MQQQTQTEPAPAPRRTRAPRAPKASEHATQRAIMQGLAAYSVPYYRINAAVFGGEYKGKKRYVRTAPKGFPDLVVFFPAGVGFVEVKAAGGQLTPEQQAFRVTCLSRKIIHVVARSWDDVAMWVK